MGESLVGDPPATDDARDRVVVDKIAAHLVGLHPQAHRLSLGTQSSDIDHQRSFASEQRRSKTAVEIATMMTAGFAFDETRTPYRPCLAR